MRCRVIEVSYAAGVCDAAGNEILRSIAELGVRGVEAVTVVNLYRIEGDLSEEEVRRIAREILADRISQKSRIRRCGSRRIQGRYAEVWLKPGVTDPVAETTVRAIRDIGIRTEVSVATGIRYLFSGNVSRQTVDTICSSLLVNSLIHDYSVG